jgi:hypothetical protein
VTVEVRLGCNVGSGVVDVRRGRPVDAAHRIRAGAMQLLQASADARGYPSGQSTEIASDSSIFARLISKSERAAAVEACSN